MNSIRRPRRRPRVESYNFRTFGWVLMREAYVAAVKPPRSNYSPEFELRRWLCTVPSHRVRAILDQVLLRHPDWRYT